MSEGVFERAKQSGTVFGSLVHLRQREHAA